jgi:hypothetical protein
MLLSDLIHRPVAHAEGHPLGRVVEVHLVQDGPAMANGDRRLRVDGLVVGRRGLMARLGLHRPEASGPTAVTWVARAVCGDHLYLSWDQIDDVPDEPGGTVVVSGEPGPIPDTTR